MNNGFTCGFSFKLSLFVFDFNSNAKIIKKIVSGKCIKFTTDRQISVGVSLMS